MGPYEELYYLVINRYSLRALQPLHLKRAASCFGSQLERTT